MKVIRPKRKGKNENIVKDLHCKKIQNVVVHGAREHTYLYQEMWAAHLLYSIFRILFLLAELPEVLREPNSFPGEKTVHRDCPLDYFETQEHSQRKFH
jgi:hypothetical protein